MRTVLKNAMVYTDSDFAKLDVAIEDGVIVDISPNVEGGTVFDFNNFYIFPGFADVHVHLREPGFSYKETIKTGTEATPMCFLCPISIPFPILWKI